MNATTMTTADKVIRVHRTGGTINLHTPSGDVHRCTVPHVSVRLGAATFAWVDRRGNPCKVTLRIV
jgi:hypothetical protein